MRTGLITKKIGMTRVLDVNGNHFPVTLLKLDSCKVLKLLESDRDGYSAVQLGFGRAKKVSKPLKGFFAKGGWEPSQKIAEFRIPSGSDLRVGDEFSVNHFVPGQFVDVSGTSKGKGFAGGMKRHNFGGLRASHGVSVSHRSHGSTGQRQDPGRTFKGKKMAGHLGDERVTVHNLKVYSVDAEEGIIVVVGAVPGSSGSYVFIRDAVKRSSEVFSYSASFLRRRDDSSPQEVFVEENENQVEA